MTTYLMQAVSSTDNLLYGWQWSVPDFAGAGFPGPGSATHVAVAARSPGGAGLTIAKFPNDLNPFALYNLEGNLLDTSGNSRDTTGTNTRFIDIYPGFTGFTTDSGSAASRTDQNFNITGALTILAMVQANSYLEFNCFNFAGTGETQAANYIYQLSAYSTLSTPRHLAYFAELNAGTDIIYSGDYASLPYIHNLTWVGMTKESQKVQFWINGRKSGALSSTLSTPNGGTTSLVHIGDTTGDATIGAVKFWDRALSDAEMVQQYNVTMGGAFGTV